MAYPDWYILKFEGMRWQRLKQPPRAIDCLSRALWLMQQSGAPAIEVAFTLNYLAFVYNEDNQLTLAESTLHEALKWVAKLPEDQHHLAAEDYMMLADVLSKQDRHREALEAGQKGLALHQAREPKNGYDRKVKAMVQQLKRNLADAQKRERKALRSPSRSL